MKKLAFVLAVGLLVGGAQSSNAAGSDGFLTFWSRFRTAALAGDMTALRSMTKMPLEVGYESDQDNPGRVGAAQFAAYMRTELRCQSTDGNSNLAMFRAHPLADGGMNWHDAHRATVGAFDFNNGPAGWRLTLVSIGSPAELKARLKGRCSA